MALSALLLGLHLHAYAPPPDPYPASCPVPVAAEVMGLHSGPPREPKTKADRDFNAYQLYAVQHLVLCGRRTVESLQAKGAPK